MTIGHTAMGYGFVRFEDESVQQHAMTEMNGNFCSRRAPMRVALVANKKSSMYGQTKGLVFKEGLCYGKLEAGLLTFIIPSVLLGHLSSLMDDGVKVTLLGDWMTLFVVFAGRKFFQPIKDDIGDKSVFMFFNALPEAEKEAVIEKLKQQIKTSES